MGKYGLLLAFLVTRFFFAAAGENIVSFEEPFTLTLSGKFNNVSFEPEQEAVEYTADKPWALGLGIRYKLFSMRLYVPLYFTSGGSLFRSFDIQANSYYDAVYYEAFCKRYQDFVKEPDESAPVDLNLFFAGISAGWIQNNKNHSLNAVYDLGGKQLSSSGSLLLGGGLYYTSINGNAENMEYYRNKQRLLYFGPNIGYSYTFVFLKGFFFNINIVTGIDAGINLSENKWLFIPAIIPKIAMGYHGAAWSVNFIGGSNTAFLIRGWDVYDYLAANTVTLSFSKRFSFVLRV